MDDERNEAFRHKQEEAEEPAQKTEGSTEEELLVLDVHKERQGFMSLDRAAAIKDQISDKAASS